MRRLGASGTGRSFPRGLRSRIVILAAALVIASVTGTLVPTLLLTTEQTRADARQIARSISEHHAHLVEDRLNRASEVARSLRTTLLTLRANEHADRALAVDLLRRTLARHDSLFGVWAGFEPEAFDGRDAAYAGTAGHDASGRFIPYLYRSNGSIRREPLRQYAEPGRGAYYQRAKYLRHLVVLEPFRYAIEGAPTLMTSIAVPLLDDGTVIGVAGVDLTMRGLQAALADITPYGTGYGMLVSHRGTIVTHPRDDLLGAGLDRAQAAPEVRRGLRQGRPVLAELPAAFHGAGAIQVATPVEIGRTGTPWSFVVTLPRDRVFAAVDDLRTNAILIAVSAVLVAVGAALVVGLESMGREVAEAANRAKSRFLANMNHELRTPLNAVIGFAEMIEKQMLGPIAPRYVDYAGEIRKSGQHLSSLVNDILDFSRIESGELRLAYEAVELRELAQDCIALVQAGVDCRGVALENRVPPDLQALRADPQRLRQILVNLLTNAVKFSERGGRVAVDARDAGEGIAIEIRDEGIGMSPEEVARVTEPFVQLDAGLQRRHGGTGLGLSLVDRFVRLHGGQLAIRSAPGAGTTVTVHLPNPGPGREALRRVG